MVVNLNLILNLHEYKKFHNFIHDAYEMVIKMRTVPYIVETEVNQSRNLSLFLKNNHRMNYLSEIREKMQLLKKVILKIIQ